MLRLRLKSLLAVFSSLVVVSAFLPVIAWAADNPGPGGAHKAAPQVKYGAVVDTAASFSGRAYGAQVHVLLPAPATRLYADTGVLASAGGSVSASLASITDAVFSSGPTSCNAQGSNTLATSASTMANLSAFAGTAVELSCTSISADASASCVGTNGFCSFSGLVFAGASVVVTGAANQTISVAGATLVINEQILAAGSITVNALHLTLASGDELTICSSHSDIICQTTPNRLPTWGSVKAIYR